MKKFMWLIAFALCSLGANAEKVVGTYTMGGMSREIEASSNNDGSLKKIYIEVLGEYKNDKVYICISGEDELNQFISKLTFCKEKYIEWGKVAEDNSITDYTKPFDATFPSTEIYWRGSEWFSTYKRNYLTPIFMVSSEGKASLGAGGKAKHWDNEYIDQQWYLILISASEFDGLINALNPEKIKAVLNKNENADALFQ